MKLPSFIALGLCSVVLVASLRSADAPPSGEDRLRGALRDALIQLRSAQTDLASLQAVQASIADEKKSLSDRYEALKKQVAAERAANDKSSTALAAQVAEQKGKIEQLSAALAKSRAEAEKGAEDLRQALASGEKLKTDKILLERKVADLQSKNLALFMTGNAILSRYAEFGLGTAITAKEPFVGKTRAKLENLVQDYQDDLSDQRAK